jgi:cell division transport system ATP-binding protein
MRREERQLSEVAEFESVGLRYGTGAEVLRDLDFRLEQGGFYFLTGPSGAGKTSLL